MKTLLILLVCLLLLMGGVAIAKARAPQSSQSIDRTPVRKFDLARYMGTWYEIARFDHKFERGLEAVQTTYTLEPDNRVKVENSGYDLRKGRRSVAVGKGRATDIPGRLRVSFFWIFYSDYNVLELGPDYGWALVGSSSPKYLWILSRTPTLPQETLDEILHLARQRGYDTEGLIYVDQSL